MQEKQTQILIVGGGTGGVAAALAALRLGQQVILTEETDWIGGQLTAQAVPPDENPWIDRQQTGCTASYRRFREGIRAYYRRNYPLVREAMDDPFLNPGRGNVSPLCHEPRIGLAVLNEMLAPYLSNRQLEIIYRVKPITAETDGDRVTSVTVQSLDDSTQMVIRARYIIDATELGELLKLANVEHVI